MGTVIHPTRASQVALVLKIKKKKKPPANVGGVNDMGSILGWGKIPWRKKLQPTPVFLPGESQFMESPRVRHDCRDLVHRHIHPATFKF